jgi:bacteriocin-like protein
MASTKCLISAQTVNRFTVTARALRQRGRTRPGDWMFRAGLMEKIMTFTERELRDDELQQVSGGVVNIERLDTTVTTTDSGLLSPGVINVLIESIVGSLASRAAISARGM